jgi:hypothetical protein
LQTKAPHTMIDDRCDTIYNTQYLPTLTFDVVRCAQQEIEEACHMSPKNCKQIIELADVLPSSLHLLHCVHNNIHNEL